MAQTKLEAIGLRHEYYQPRTGGRLLALDNVNLKVEDGEFVTIVGPSGCGKTTFINLADGLLKPTAGKLSIDGKQVTGPGIDRGMVFQDSCLMPWRTVLKNVLFGLECQRLDNADGQSRARKFIKLVGLEGFEEHYPHELSGGMQQRCNLARALTVDPKILIMDEPLRRSTLKPGKSCNSSCCESGGKRRKRCCSSRTRSTRRFIWRTA